MVKFEKCMQSSLLLKILRLIAHISLEIKFSQRRKKGIHDTLRNSPLESYAEKDIWTSKGAEVKHVAR